MKHRETAALLIARLIGVALLYFATAQLGLAFAVVGDTVTLVWPPSGIALVALLVFGYRIAPGGLASALEQLAEDTRALKGMNCTLNADPEVRVSDPRAAINLYRIAQESINNAVRHSQARHLWIDLTSVRWQPSARDRRRWHQL